MSNNTRYFDLATMAEASYVLFNEIDYRDPGQLENALSEANEDDYNGRFSEAQADAFLSHWQVLDHQPNTASGFSGTLFQRIDDDPINGYEAGDLVFALRGTETGLTTILDDLYQADFTGIVANGLAFRQIVDMYNYWQRLITPEGDSAQQARLVLAPSGTPDEKIIDESGFKWMIEFEYSALGLGRVDLNDNLVAATGHSLGGHLATAFSRLFPGWTTNAVTINGAGYPNGEMPGLTGSALQNIDNLFSSLGGASDFDASKILNLFGDKGPEVTTMNEPWGLMQQGLHAPVYIEDALGNSLGHGASQMTDALAVYDLFIDLVPALKNGAVTDSFGDLLRLSEVASSQAPRSYESLVNAIAELFKVDTKIAGTDDREALYRGIAEIRASTTAYSRMLGDKDNLAVLVNLSDYTDPAFIAEKAHQEPAFRYALKTLSPFVLLNADDVYAQHNQNQELELYNPATRQGMTDAYLHDRAVFVLALMAWNRLDESPDIQTATSPSRFEDLRLDIAIDNSLRIGELPIEVDEAQRYLFGKDSADHLVGGGKDDVLYGSAGHDRLTGGGGADYLEGGNGHDTYFADAGDEIFDHDGEGRVVFDDALLGAGARTGADGVYESADRAFQYTLTDGDLIVSRLDDGAALKIANFVDGHLGISLEQSDPPPLDGPVTNGSNDSDVIYGRTDPRVTDYALVDGYNLPDQIHGHDGRDWIYAWDNGPQTIENGVVINSAPDRDIVEGGSGRDFIHGGAGNDRLYATEILDVAGVEAGQGSLAYGGPSDDEGDFVSGQSGDDELYGSGRVDGLFGGDGDDLIHGGGGDDIIAGDWSAVVSTLSMNPTSHDYDWYTLDANGGRQLQLAAYNGGIGNDRIYAGDGEDLVWGGAADDTLYGGTGDDQLNGDIAGVGNDGNPKLSAELHGNDFISGGQGNDALNGNGGTDILLGGAGNDILDGDFRLVLDDDASYHGDDYLDGGDGEDILSGNGGSDVLLGGDHDDALFGDMDGLDARYHGADVLYGGGGNDQLVGQGGGDTLHGGSEDDVLYGDDIDQFILNGDDSLFGGTGADELSGGLGNDVLAGGEDRDSLWGDPGDDRLSGGPGLDYLEGGTGSDTYLFSAGDSTEDGGELETIVDSAGEGNRIEFASDVRQESLKMTPLDDSGDLILRYAGADAVYVFGGLTGSIESYSFGGDSAISYQSLISTVVPYAHYLDGGAGDDLVFGSGRDDVLEGGGGDDQLLGGDGSDLLDGGSGTNRLVGGAGTDTYLISANPDSAASRFSRHEIIDSMDRTSIVRFGTGVEATDLNLQFFGSTVLVSAGMHVLVLADGASGDLVNRFEFASGDVLSFQELKTLHAIAPNPIAGTVADDVLLGSADNDSISGDAGDDQLSGGAGRDRLDGGPGADLMAGGAGYDTYVVDHAGDSVVETEGAGYDFVISSVDYSLPAHVEGLELSGSDPISGSGNAMGNYIAGNAAANLLSGGNGDDRIQGGGGLDVIYGGAGDDQLEGLFQVFGGAGNDHIVSSTYISNGTDPIYELAGGPGDDIYQISQPQHMWGPEPGGITEYADEGIDTLILRADVMILSDGLPDNVENLRYDYSGELWNGDGVVLIGNALNNRIEIGTPNPGSRPRIAGLGGDDVLVGSSLDESGSEDAGLFGGDGNDRLHGLGGNDRLEGGSGDDVLEGGRGFDLLFGGTGEDTYMFSPGDSLVATGMSVIEDPDGASVIRLGKGVRPEDLTFEVDGADLLVNYSANDTFVLKGGAGTYQIAGYTFASGAFFTQNQLDRFLQGNTAPLLSRVAPTIVADEGRPVSVDLPYGLFVDPDGDALQYSLSSEGGPSLPEWLGFEPLASSLQINADDGDAGIYELQLLATDPEGETASANIAIEIRDVFFSAGTSDADLVKGTAAIDNLSAGTGDDRLYGYAGDDWLMAGEGADTLFGGAGDDRLLGGAGNDVLNGQTGDDALIGGVGDDRYYIDTSDDSVVELADEGLDRVYSQVEYRLGDNLEELILRGEVDIGGSGNTADNRLYGNVADNRLSGEAGDDRLYGRDGNDHLIGGAGNDILNGQAGDDEMTGGMGDDRYYIDSVGDSVLELADEGQDRVYSLLGYRLDDNLEDLVLKGEADLDGVGNAGINRLYGNPGANELRGEAGDDRLYGREGDDHLFGGAGDDILNGQAGDDEMIGGAGNDRLYGREGNDQLHGGPGNDLLDGGPGSDEYRFGRGDGVDRIRGVAGEDPAGDRDSLVFEWAISSDQIWFSRAGNDLLAQIIGTADQIRVSGWYSNEPVAVDTLRAGEGELINADRLDQLVNAMAGFGVQRAAVIELSPEQQTGYSTMVAAYWGTAGQMPA